MNILILDAYPKKSYRISKDVNGGYGIAHNYGTTLFSKLLRLYVKYSIDFPPLYVAQVCGELLNCGHNVTYCDTGKSIKELKSELNLQNLQVWSNFPGVKHEHCMKSIKLFTEKVMPHFKNGLKTKIKKVS